MYRARTVYASAGFTLVELIVVAAIMAMMALIAAPWFYKITQRNRIKSAANEIQTTLMAARMVAVRRNQPVTVLVTTAAPSDPAHVFETFEPPPPAGTPTPPPRRLEIATSTIEFVGLPVGGNITFAGDGRMITPAPVAPAEIIVSGPVGALTPNQITIETSVSGRVKVRTPPAWY